MFSPFSSGMFWSLQRLSELKTRRQRLIYLKLRCLIDAYLLIDIWGFCSLIIDTMMLVSLFCFTYSLSHKFIMFLQTIGQAYEDMQTQNQHLLQQVTERDDYNIKVRVIILIDFCGLSFPPHCC